MLINGVKDSLESSKKFKCGQCLNVVASVEMSDSKAESATVGLESVPDTFYNALVICRVLEVESERRFALCRVRCAWGKFNELVCRC